MALGELHSLRALVDAYGRTSRRMGANESENCRLLVCPFSDAVAFPA
jgi:hypothetical protein